MKFQHEPHYARGLSTRLPVKSTAGYRINFRDQETNSWRVYANFQFLGEAEACLSELLQRGIEAQMHSELRYHSHA